MKKVIYLATTLAFTGAMSMSAQTVKKDTVKARTVVVEQEYTPNKRKAKRLLLTPESNRPGATNKASKFDTSIQDKDQVVSGVMSATPASTGLFEAPLNSLHMGYGANNYTVFDANFLTQLSEQDKLQGYIGLHGFDDDDISRRTYTTTARVNYQHKMSDRILEASGEVDNHVFNYRPGGNQRHTSTDWSLRYDSRGKDWVVPFHNKIRLTTFNEAHPVLDDDNTETRLQIISGAQVKPNEHFSIGGDVEINSFWYSLDGKEMSRINGGNEFEIENELKNYSTASLRPYFMFAPNNWSIKMGASVDLSFDNGDDIRVAPDVQAEYDLGHGSVFYANATGGKIINDYRNMASVSPYSLLLLRNVDAYEQLNANLGLRMSPVMGLWMNLCAGYQNLDDYLVQAPIFVQIPANQGPAYDLVGAADLDRFYLTFDGQYTDNDWGLIDWKFALYNNDIDEAEELQCMLPVFSLKLGVEYNILDTVRMRLGYHYEARDADAAEETFGGEVDDISNLSLSVTLPIHDNIEIWGSVVNLLDEEYYDYTTAQTLGLTTFGGVTVKF